MDAVVPVSAVGVCPSRGPTVHEPTRILVVDDSAFDRHVVGQLLGSLKDVELVFADNGCEGLAAIERDGPAVILTDLVMPDMEGLELVRQVRARHPHIAVVLVTAYGSEEVAMQALRAGAVNYVPKRRMGRDLVPTIRQALSIAVMTRERLQILQRMVRRESAFVLENDPELILPLLKLLHEEIEGLNLCDQGCQLQIGVALQEALYNALFHGNLEVSSDLRQDDERLFDALVEERREQEPYCLRRIHVHVQLDRDAARFIVADDGPGFDTVIFDRPVAPEDLSRIGGRGLLLIRTFMDHVSFNKSGSQITMVKRRSPA